jgi:ribosomal protein L7/L12
MKLIVTLEDIRSAFADKYGVNPDAIEIATPESSTITPAQVEQIAIVLREVAQAAAYTADAATRGVDPRAPNRYEGGNKITAIKAWRTLTGDGLLEAKNFIEATMGVSPRLAPSQLKPAW